jgi:outer membrane biosynthesis protein TonB
MTRRARAARILPVVLLSLALGGCGGHHVVAPAPDAPVLGPPLALTPADSSVAPADSLPAPMAPGDSTTTPMKAVSEAKTPPAQTPAQSPPTTPPAPEQKMSPDQEVGVKLDEGKRADLAAQTRKDLEEAERLVSAVDASTLGLTAQEKVATVKSLIASSRAAYGTDVEAAAALAHKARLLAGELGKG